MISEASFNSKSNDYRWLYLCISKQSLHNCQWAVARDILNACFKHSPEDIFIDLREKEKRNVDVREKH